MSRRAPKGAALPPVPALDRVAARKVATLVSEYEFEGATIPPEVNAAADRWVRGQGGQAEWEVLYRWGARTLEGPDAGILPLR